jgi:hypothetical protein
MVTFRWRLCEQACRAFTVVDLRESFGVILNALSSVVREAEHAVVYRDEAQ